MNKQIETKKTLLEVWDKGYYSEGESLVSNDIYDQTKREYIAMGGEYKTVGFKPNSGLRKVKHVVPMLSMDNIFSPEELKSFIESTIPQELYSGTKVSRSYISEPKFDGVACSLLFIHGALEVGSTRGDGLVGEDVTASVKRIANIPKALLGKDVPYEVEVRGEVVMLKQDFNEYNLEAIHCEYPPLSNPRNAAAGALRTQELKRNSIPKKLYFYPYSIFSETDIVPDSYRASMGVLESMGFETLNTYRVESENWDDHLRNYESLLENRDKIPFEIDGMVIKVNSTTMTLHLGDTGRSPRWATAYKFPAQEAITVLESVIWGVGRTGVVTPVGTFNKPVLLGGVSISRSTLHNCDEIKRLGIKIGDKIVVKRAADVIPKIVAVLETTEKSVVIPIPDKCPSCGGILLRVDGEAALRCNAGYSCKAQLKRFLEHYVSRDAMNIIGLGGAIIDELVSKELVISPVDFYRLEMKDLLCLIRMGERKAQNLLDNINYSKDTTLAKFIYSLGIPDVGRRMSSTLANNFLTLDGLLSAKPEDLYYLDSVGDIMADRIYNFIAKTENREMVKLLIDQGIVWPCTVPSRAGNIYLKNKSFVITGSFDKYNRSDLEETIITGGGKVSSSVSSKTDYLLCGKNAGSKLQRAVELNITVLSEDEIPAILGPNIVTF